MTLYIAFPDGTQQRIDTQPEDELSVIVGEIERAGGEIYSAEQIEDKREFDELVTDADWYYDRMCK